jgi:hypothetical protein
MRGERMKGCGKQGPQGININLFLSEGREGGTKLIRDSKRHAQVSSISPEGRTNQMVTQGRPGRSGKLFLQTLSFKEKP